MLNTLDVVIVERLGSLRTLSIKDFKQNELYKKCGFKKAEDFNKQVEWNSKINGNKYTIQLYAKIDGRANSENKYDFPPPVDSALFYGSCALVGYIKNDDGTKTLTNLKLDLWNKIYEKLFGGFEDLAATAKEDEEEEDELANVPKEKKTKQGYLKDGFVVDSSENDENSQTNTESDTNDDDEIDSEDLGDLVNEAIFKLSQQDEEMVIEDIGSELSEESYDYDDDDKIV